MKVHFLLLFKSNERLKRKRGEVTLTYIGRDDICEENPKIYLRSNLIFLDFFFEK